MNKKITNKIGLIIITFLILSSSLFSAGLADPVGILEGIAEFAAHILMGILIIYIILIAIIAGINYGLRKEPEMRLIVNIVMFLCFIILSCIIILYVLEESSDFVSIVVFLFLIPIIITIAGMNSGLREHKPRTRIIANIVIFLCIIVSIIFIRVSRYNSILTDNLIYAAQDNDTNRIDSILKSRIVNINARSYHGYTALMWASEYGNLEAAKLLIENGADVNAKDKYGDTALIEAGHLEVVKLLIENGADVNVENEFGENALMRASEYGNLEKVKLLIEKEADVNAKNEDGKTALMRASREGHLEVVKYLIENGADVNAKSNNGWTALMRASYNGHLEVVKYLIENGADVNAKRDSGRTALMRASREGHLEVVKLLIENGADVNAKDDIYGQTALDLADTEEIEEVLRKAGAK